MPAIFKNCHTQYIICKIIKIFKKKEKTKMGKSEEFQKELIEMADALENLRMKIYQTKTNDVEDKKEIDDKLFSLQSQIRDVGEIVQGVFYE